jgi:hypothetical protein
MRKTAEVLWWARRPMSLELVFLLLVGDGLALAH